MGPSETAAEAGFQNTCGEGVGEGRSQSPMGSRGLPWGPGEAADTPQSGPLREGNCRRSLARDSRGTDLPHVWLLWPAGVSRQPLVCTAH